MPHYAQLDRQGRFLGIVYYSTPPMGYHAALAAECLKELKEYVQTQPPANRPQFDGSLALLHKVAAELRRNEVAFDAKLQQDGLELREIPEGEDTRAIYEDLELGKPEKGQRVQPSFEAKADTWPRLEAT